MITVIRSKTRGRKPRPNVSPLYPFHFLRFGSAALGLEQARASARRFLTDAHARLGLRAAFLIGVDLVQDLDVRRAAYNDAAGVTAAFNLNGLARMKREPRGHVRPDRFAHSAVCGKPQIHGLISVAGLGKADLFGVRIRIRTPTCALRGLTAFASRRRRQLAILRETALFVRHAFATLAGNFALLGAIHRREAASGFSDRVGACISHVLTFHGGD